MFRNITKIACAALFTAGAAWATVAMAARTSSPVEQQVPAVQTLAKNDAVVAAVTASNSAESAWTAKQVKQYQQEWRKQVDAGQGPLLDQMKQNAASQVLQKAVADSNGLYEQLAVTNDKGKYVAEASIMRDDRFNGKGVWQKAFSDNGVYVGHARLDKKTNIKAAQVAVPVVNSDNQAIGILIAWIVTDKLAAK